MTGPIGRGLLDDSGGTAFDLLDLRAPIVQAPIAAVAPHAPDAPNPQGLATGTIQSGTGRFIVPDAPAADGDPQAIEPVGADKPGVAGEQTPQKGAAKSKPSK